MSSFKIISKNKDGSYRLRLSKTERNWLATQSMELAKVLETQDLEPIVLRRLLPEASLADEKLNTSFKQSYENQIIFEKTSDLKSLSEICKKEILNEDELDVLLKATNSIRLTLGTLLVMTPEGPGVLMDEKTTAIYALYQHLSYIQQEIVDEMVKN